MYARRAARIAKAGTKKRANSENRLETTAWRAFPAIDAGNS
jgi:hypothetical protein